MQLRCSFIGSPQSWVGIAVDTSGISGIKYFYSEQTIPPIISCQGASEIIESIKRKRMRFETDPEWGGYFIRRMTIPVDAEGTLEDGMLRMSSLDVSDFLF